MATENKETKIDDEKKASEPSENKNGTNKDQPNDVKPTEPKIVHSEYVVVADASGEPMEVPTTAENALSMTTLQASFPGATGLKYKNPKTGASRAVQVDPTGVRLLPPADGWDDKVFTVILPMRSDVSAKRRKVGSDSDESDSEVDAGRSGRKRAAAAHEEPRRPIDLIVLGISYKTQDDIFRKYFEDFGTVIFAEIKKHSDGTSKGFGFVRMGSIEEQDRVMSQAQHVIDSRRCDVKIPDQKHSPGVVSRAPIMKIFVGRISDKISESTLSNFFNEEAKKIMDSASVTDVFIPKPFRAFAFVTFNVPEVAEKFANMGSLMIDGCSVAISLAAPRDEPPARNFYNDFGYAYGYGGKQNYGAAPAARNEPYGYAAWGVGSDGRSSRGAGSGVSGASQWAPPSKPRPQPLMSLRRPPSPSLSTISRTSYISNYNSSSQAGPSSGPPVLSRPAHYMQPYADPISAPQQSYNNVDSGNQNGLYSQAANIASGLETLDLNQKNPELLNAAWTAFFNTLGVNQQSQSWKN